jgi:hypothetical protein
VYEKEACHGNGPLAAQIAAFMDELRTREGVANWVVSRIFRTFDQATASVCMSFG